MIGYVLLGILLMALVVIVVMAVRSPRSYEAECVRFFERCEFFTHIPPDDWRGREPRICHDCSEKTPDQVNEDAVA